MTRLAAVRVGASLAVAPLRARASLVRQRDRRLQQVVAHAYAAVPYYRRLFDAHGVHPADVRGPADLGRLPITSKRDLQRTDPHALLAVGVDARRLITRKTSGSTGQPLGIRRTWREERLLGAARWRAFATFGWRPSHRHVDVEEYTPVDANDDTLLHRALARCGFVRQTRLDALRPIETILADVVRARPDVLSGYAGVIARVARLAARTDAGVRPRCVAVHSDTLTPVMRRAIEDGFGAPVYELYDANETNVIAWQCRRTGVLHTSDDTVVVEVLVDGRPARPGERGEVVLTTLHAFAMPFIRYRIGDLVEQGEPACACGAPFATLRAVQGRMFDFLPLPDGRMVHPYEIINLLGREAPWLVEYRILQDRLDSIRVWVVAAAPPGSAALDAVRAHLGAFLGASVTCVLECVDALPADGRAKPRVCTSLVASEYERP